jgi:fluoroquinolone resistance protein
MKNCIAHEVNFAETDLEGAIFTGTDFKDAVFLRTNLTKADFVGAENYTLSVTDNKTKGARFALPEAIRLL